MWVLADDQTNTLNGNIEMLELYKLHMRYARDLWADRKGISALEYGVLAAGILAAVAAGALAVGGQLAALFLLVEGWLTPA